MIRVATLNSVLHATLVIFCCSNASIGQEPQGNSPIEALKTQYASDLKKWESEYPRTVSEPERQIERFQASPAWSLLTKLEAYIDSSDEPTLFEIASLVVEVGNSIGPGVSRVASLETRVLERIQANGIEEGKLCALIAKVASPSKSRRGFLRFCRAARHGTQVRAMATFILLRSDLFLSDEIQSVQANHVEPSTETASVQSFHNFYRKQIDPLHWEFLGAINSIELNQEIEELTLQCTIEYKEELFVVDPSDRSERTIGKLVELDRRMSAGLKMASETKLQLGEKFPFIEGKDLEGNRFSLEQYRGRTIVIDFWATWCGPCMAQLPKMQELADKYRDRRVVIVGVNADVDVELARRASEKAAITWSSLHFGEESEKMIGQVFKVRQFPTIYIVDAEGIVRANNLIDRSEIEKALEQMLK